MATRKRTDDPSTADDESLQEETYVEADPAPATTQDPVGKAVDPVAVEVLDIPANEPYPTGSPAGPITYAEINGLVPIGTGPLAPPDPPVT